MKVLGLGQCSLDYLAALPSYPAEDTKMEALGLTVEGGGPVATALVALKRLGAEAVFLGVVSDDKAGVEIRRGLADEGVDTRHLVRRRGGASQTAFILVNSSNGSRTICWQRPTAAPLSPDEVKKAHFRGVDMLLLDGLMMAASIKAATIANEMGIPVMLDAGRMRPGMLDLASMSDYIVASEELVKDLRSTPKGSFRRLSKGRARAVTITLGKKGSVTWHWGGVFKSRAFRVRAVDTTGAGDVFHGAYAYGALKGWGLERTVEFASAAAALKCLKPGGRAGIAGLKETLRFIRGSKKKPLTLR